MNNLSFRSGRSCSLLTSIAVKLSMYDCLNLLQKFFILKLLFTNSLLLEGDLICVLLTFKTKDIVICTLHHKLYKPEIYE